MYWFLPQFNMNQPPSRASLPPPTLLFLLFMKVYLYLILTFLFKKQTYICMNTSIHMSLCIWIKWSSLGEPSAHWSLWSKPSPGAAPGFSCNNSPKYLYLFSLVDGSGLFQGSQLLSARPLTRHAGHRSWQGRVGASRPRDHFWALTWLFWEPSTRRLCLPKRTSGRLMSLCRLSGSTRQAIPRRELGSPATELGLHPEDGLGPSALAC